MKYTDKLAKEICSRIMSGMSVREIGRQNDMPTDTCIFNWLAQDKGKDEHGDGGFVEQYTRAKEIQAEQMGEDILNISDDAENDFMERKLKSGEIVTVVDKEHIARSRLRVESRKWLMGKLKPKKYGDRIQQDVHHSGDVTMINLDKAKKRNATKKKPED